MSSMTDNSFLSNLCEKGVTTFVSQDCENGFFDVTYIIDGKLLHAHKFVIASTSETFKQIFLNALADKSVPIIIYDFCYKDFYDFLLFAYTGKWKPDRILVMFRLSLAFQSIELREICDTYLSKIDFDAEKFYYFHDAISEEDMCLLPLFSKAIISAMKKFYPELLESERFVNATRETIKALVQCKRNYAMEEQLFKLVCKWAENQIFIHGVSDVEDYCILQIFPFIHFKLMSNKFLMDVPIQKDDLLKKINGYVCKQILQDAEISDIDEKRKVDSAAFIVGDGYRWKFVNNVLKMTLFLMVVKFLFFKCFC